MKFQNLLLPHKYQVVPNTAAVVQDVDVPNARVEQLTLWMHTSMTIRMMLSLPVKPVDALMDAAYLDVPPLQVYSTNKAVHALAQVKTL